jgi:hypothetical protein
MISGRRYQALGPLCVSAPFSQCIRPANWAHQLPAARGPPLPQERGNRQRADMNTTAPKRSPASPPSSL